MDNKLLDGFVLNNVQVLPLTGEVAGPDGSTHLPSKAVEVLLLLAKQPRHLVTREEILEKVWGDGQGSAEVLSHAVGEIRHALNDHAATPAYIQTVPKRGFRLLVEPVPLSAGDKPAATGRLPLWELLVRHGVVQAGFAYLVIGWLLVQVANTTFTNIGFPAWAEPFVTFMVIGGFPIVVIMAWFLEFAEGRMKRDRGEQPGGLFQGLERNYLAILAAYGLAALGAGIYQASTGFKVAIPNGTIATQETSEPELIPVLDNSLAVLKFHNIDGGDISRAFGDGLSEDILDGLARVPGLFVSSRTDSWSLREKPSSADIRRRLRVSYYIEGSVRDLGDKLRIVIQLINSQSGFHVFSRSFDREIKDVGGIQKEITNLVVSNLRIAMDDQLQHTDLLDASQADEDAYVTIRFVLPLQLQLI